MRTDRPQALIFDLGGVVIDVDVDRAFRMWEPISRLSLDAMKRAFRVDDHYERHERGQISAREYFSHLSSVLELDEDHAVIARGWNSIFVGEILETISLLQAARAQVPCYAFTNTNATHMATWPQLVPNVARSFDRIFASHEIGLRKPDREAFDHVARAVGVTPGAILFFDDLLENVEGAASAGLQAVHVRGPGDVREALRRIGCVP